MQLLIFKHALGRVYHALKEMGLPERRLEQLRSEFHVDSHDLWEQEDDRKQARPRQNQWVPKTNPRITGAF